MTTNSYGRHIYRTSEIPDVCAVNVAIQCEQCNAIIPGNAFWSIRSSAHLHRTSGCGGMGWALCEQLELVAS